MVATGASKGAVHSANLKKSNKEITRLNFKKCKKTANKFNDSLVSLSSSGANKAGEMGGEQTLKQYAFAHLNDIV